MAVGLTHASQSLASPTVTVNARGPAAGTPAITGPVVIDVHMALTDTPPPQLRVFGLRIPPEFSIVSVPPCDADTLRTRGSGACAKSRLGTGKAWAYVPIFGGSTVTTRELGIFRSAGDGIILYARIDGIDPVLLSGVLEDRPTEDPLLRFQLDNIGMGATLTRADMTLTRGLQANSCLTGFWTFTSQLEFVGVPPARTTHPVPCAQPPAPAPAPLAPSAPSAPSVPSLRASARNGTRVSGVRLAFVLSEPARITITLQRRAGGHWITVRSLAVRKPAGSTSRTIRTAHKHPLRAGRYRARLQAVNAAGAQSTPQTVRFTIRRGGMRRR